jgi:hypothetical protein
LRRGHWLERTASTLGGESVTFADSKEVSFTSTEKEISCTRSDSEA